MRKQHHVIYVPGILDDVYHQRLAVKTWRLYGVRGHLHVMPWLGDEAYKPKLQRLLDEIDSYRAKGHRVSLFGVSAAASAVINAYMERKDDITGVVYAVAKIQAPETVSNKIYAKNPAFKTSIYELQDNLKKLTQADKAKMHSFYSPADGYVPHAATVIPGVRETRLPALRHGWAITYCLTLGARKILAPMKEQAKKS
jgi:hypothetical protein